MEAVHTIDVRRFLDDSPIGGFRILIAVLICLIVFVDGLDVSAIAFAVPEIIREWGVTKQQMAPILGSVFFGLAAGALVAGPIADKAGRKLVIVASVFGFGMFTALAATSASLAQLLIYRLLAGVALGAALPNAVTLMAEYAPSRRRALFVTLVYSGFTLGATSAGLVAAWLIPVAGWRVTLGSCGLFPMTLAVVLAFLLPDSPLFLAAKAIKPALVRRLLSKVDPAADLPAGSSFSVPQPVKATENPITVILSGNYALTSVTLWASYFLGVFVVYFLFNWMPVMAREAGFNVSQSAIITSMFTLSGAVGSILIGAAMDSVRPAFVLVTRYLLAAGLLWVMSLRPDNYHLLCVLSFSLGFFIHGMVPGLNALATKAYPPTASATGVSWMQGWGRTGGIASAFAGGVMLSLGWGLATVLVALAIPLILASAALLTLGLSRSVSSQALRAIPTRSTQTSRLSL